METSYCNKIAKVLMHFYAVENELSYKAIFKSEIVFEYYMQKCLFQNKLTLLLEWANSRIGCSRL